MSRSDLTRTVQKVQKKHVVVLVNVELPSRYTWDDSNNAILAAVDRQFTNVVLVNWQKKASRHPGWLYSDGIHLTPSGRLRPARGQEAGALDRSADASVHDAALTTARERPRLRRRGSG